MGASVSNPNFSEPTKEPGSAGAVLIADDDPAIRLVLRHRLEADGMRVEEAGDSASALAALRANRFDVARAEPAHIGFGTGQHFCLGARLAEMQIRTFYEEFLRRYPEAQPCGPVQRMRSNFIVGYKSIPTRLHG